MFLLGATLQGMAAQPSFAAAPETRQEAAPNPAAASAAGQLKPAGGAAEAGSADAVNTTDKMTARGPADAGQQAEIPGLLTKIDRLLSSAETQIQTEPARWAELEAFHSELWRALALDPIQGLSVNERQSEVLTRDLEAKLSRLVASPVISQLQAKEDFNEYASKCQELIELRKKRFYREARKYARSGGLDRLYANLIARIRQGGAQGHVNGIRMSVILPGDLDAKLREAIERLHQVTDKTEPGSAVNPALARPSSSKTIVPAREAPVASSASARAARLSTSVTALLVANLLWIIVSISAFFTGKSLSRKSPAMRDGVAPSPGRLKVTDWLARYQVAVERQKKSEARDQEVIRKLNGFAWTFSQFFVRYHMEEPLANLERFRKELQDLSETLRNLVTQTRDCISSDERGYGEILEQLRELGDSVDPAGRPATGGERIAA